MISPNTQAILLLTAPLIAGRGETSTDLLTYGEYNRIDCILYDIQREPADFLASHAGEIIEKCRSVVDGDRLERLLARGFLLSQAVEKWEARAIWVVSRIDPHYPGRLKLRLKQSAPPILYGCGDRTILDSGGLAVVGSRNVDRSLVEYTENIGRLAAEARCVIISGGARGIDQAAMRGALEAGGCISGVLSDSLERAALTIEHREAIMDGRLVLISPYDPAAGFHVGQAMQRNKLIYALSDAALVVSSEYEKGGTWAGAIEQLHKLRLVPVYVRSEGEIGKGLNALRHKGALHWPNPKTPEEFKKALVVSLNEDNNMPGQYDISFKVKELLERNNTPMKEAEIAADLQMSRSKTRQLLKRLVNEGVLVKFSKPAQYRIASCKQTDFLH